MFITFFGASLGESQLIKEMVNLFLMVIISILFGI